MTMPEATRVVGGSRLHRRLSANKLICRIRYELICLSRERWCQPPGLTKMTLVVLTPISAKEDGAPTCCSISGPGRTPKHSSIQETRQSGSSTAAIAVSRLPSSTRVSGTVLESSIGRYAIGTTLRHRRRGTCPSSLSSVEQILDRARTQISASRSPRSLWRATYCPVPTGLISGLIFLQRYGTRVTRGDAFS
jgi:hypothetical protein